jgi:hypothetical protein
LLDLLSTHGKSGLGSSLGSCWLGLHSGLDLAGHGQKRLFYVGGGLGGSLEEFNAQGVSKLLTLFGRHDALAGQIGLVANQQFVDILCCISVNFVEPLLDIVERFLVGDIVDNNNSMGATVIRRSDGAETFLSCGIPNLKLDGLSVQFDGTDFLQYTHGERQSRNKRQQTQKKKMRIQDVHSEFGQLSGKSTFPLTYKVHTNRRDVGFGVGIIGKSEQQTRFTNTRISNEEELEQIVAAK